MRKISGVNVKKLIIALIFAQASYLTALPTWLNVDNLRKAEETVVQNSAKGTKYCAQGLFSISDKLNNFAAFIKNEATVDQVKKYAYVSAVTIACLLVMYGLYKRAEHNRQFAHANDLYIRFIRQSKANGTYPQSSGASNLTGN